MSTPLINHVEDQLDQLISHCHKLEKENATLKAKEQGWQQERQRLMEKNEIARKRVESMIQHLKDLESESQRN